MQRKTDLFDCRPKRFLHIAPEPALARQLRKVINIDYLSGDIGSEAAMVKLDITAIAYPDSTFDVVYCSHVLEHVPDDRSAMREMRRVLKQKGWAILLVPVEPGPTIEDPRVTDPADRLRLYGQDDHVRIYGAEDFVARLKEAGFTVRVDRFIEQVSYADQIRYGLPRDLIYYCGAQPME